MQRQKSIASQNLQTSFHQSTVDLLLLLTFIIILNKLSLKIHALKSN